MTKEIMRPGKDRALRALVLASMICLVSYGFAQTTGSAEEISDYIASQPFDPQILEQLTELLYKAETEDQKFMLELTRRVDFYFYVSDRMEELMDVYSSSFLPFLYQRDIFSGDAINSTPSILRSAPVLVVLNGFIQILQPFYALAILLTALYLLFVSGSPAGRSKAKSSLIKLIIGLGLITLTIPIMEMLLEMAHYLTSLIISLPEDPSIAAPIDMAMFAAIKEFFSKYFLRITFFDTLMALPFLIAFVLLPVGVLLILAVRYFMVILLTVCFPFTVLLYSFSATKKIGRNLLSQMALWTFLPVIEAILLLAGWAAYSSTPYIEGIMPKALSDISAFLSLSCFLLLIAAPFIGLWVIRWLGSMELFSYIIVNTASMMRLYKKDDEGEAEDEDFEEDAEEVKEEVGDE